MGFEESRGGETVGAVDGDEEDDAAVASEPTDAREEVGCTFVWAWTPWRAWYRWGEWERWGRGDHGG